MFHLLLATDLRRAQTAEECFPRCWITQSFIASPHRRILGTLSWHADYTKSPRAAVSYCLTKQRPRALSAVVSLMWICDEARESTLDTFVTPLLPTYTLMPCMGSAFSWLRSTPSPHSSLSMPHPNSPWGCRLSGGICCSRHLIFKLNSHATHFPLKMSAI